ncbi:MAG: fibronectin type III domain-containing protein, partial [Planctomycetota bacterium]
NVTITQLGAYMPAGVTNWLRIWNDGGTLLGSIQVTAGGSNGWYWGTLGTPINLTSGQYYRVGRVGGGSTYWYGSATFPYSSGIYTVVDYGYYYSGDGMPNSNWTNSPMNVGVNGNIYQSSSTVQSIKLNSGSTVTSIVCLNPAHSIPANTTISYEVTANGGANWYGVTPNVSYSLPVTGTDLRWKATLSTSDTSATPSIDTLIIESDAASLINVTSNLTAAVMSTSQIDLAWQNSATDETNFEISRSTPLTANWTVIANNVAANSVTYSDTTGIIADTTYYYRVRSYNVSGYDPWSNEASALTSLPAAPSGLITTTVGAYNITLQWADNSINENGFEMWRSPDGSSWAALTDTIAANATSFDNTGLTKGTAYYYKIRSYNGIGYSATYSNVISSTTLAHTYVGNGQNGAITLSAGNWNTTVYGNNGSQPEGFNTYINGNASLSATTLSVQSVAGFNIGDEVLIYFGHSASWATRDTNAGKYYFTKITAKPGTITVQDELPWAVTSANDRVQVIRVPNYTSVTVTGVVTGDGWDLANGKSGIICFRAMGTVLFTSGGSINFSNLGYKNQSVANDDNANATPGTGHQIGSGYSGGGGTYGQYGGYGLPGSDTENPNTLWKNRLLLGTSDMSRIYMGGAGGFGSNSVRRGGYGGGIVWILAETINFSNLTGCIKVNGEGGQSESSGWNCSAGGGAGGSIRLVVYNIVSMTNYAFSATGGGGSAHSQTGGFTGEDGQYNRGGNGATGSAAGGSGSSSGSGGGGAGEGTTGQAAGADYGGRGGRGSGTMPGGGGGAAGRIRIDYHTVNGTIFNGFVPIPTLSPAAGYAADIDY